MEREQCWDQKNLEYSYYKHKYTESNCNKKSINKLNVTIQLKGDLGNWISSFKIRVFNTHGRYIMSSIMKP